MTTERYEIQVQGVRVEVVRKDIKNFHLGVYPPEGRVRAAVPRRLDDAAVRVAVASRLGWIRRQRARFEEQERQSAREMVSGECHYFRGRRYRLSVVERDAPSGVSLLNDRTLELQVRPGAGREQREAVLQRWYREQLREQVPELIAKWEPRVGVTVADCGIRRMKTRWGSCNSEARRIWVNLELAKKSDACLELVLLHEMVHLLERRHSERFREHMDRLMPQWRLYRDQLNRAPLAHEEWEL